MPKISIIVVTYNAENVIESTLRSLEPYKNSVDVELFFKDGNSSDRTVSIIKDVMAARNVVIHIDDDINVYDGMNQAVERVRGEFIIFINAGDELIKLDLDGLVDSSTCFYWDEARDSIKRDRATVAFLTRNTPCHQSVIYKKDEFLKFDVMYGLAADFEQIVRIVKLRNEGLSLNSSIVKYANPGLSSEFFEPSLIQLFSQLTHRYKTISNNFGMIERAMCIIFSITTVLRKLMKDILK
ncbi:glycosyltransferase [Vibrio sp. M260112]|uniref:glycosyltransferase n=1 Tax=Vibrio sp. M260112 TaxID=3020895 RepID=UPI002F3F16FC